MSGRGAQPAKVVELPRQPKRAIPLFDSRLPGLLFDALGIVEAAIASAASGLPYRAVRQASLLEEPEKRELSHAALAAAEKHPEFFAKHKDLIEVAVAATAFHAAKIDAMRALIDQADTSASTGEPTAVHGKPCSTREALWIAAIVLAPLVFVGVLLLCRRGK